MPAARQGNAPSIPQQPPPLPPQRSTTPRRGRSQARSPSPEETREQTTRDADDPRQWLLAQRLTAAQAGLVEDMLRESGHSFTVATLERLGVQELREAVEGAAAHGPQPSDDAAAAARQQCTEWLVAQGLGRDHIWQIERTLRESGHSFDKQTLERLGVQELREAVEGAAAHGPQPSDDAAAAARQQCTEWLVAQGLGRDHIWQIERTLRESGHSFDKQTLERVGIEELRAAVAAQRGRGRHPSQSIARHLSQPGDPQPERVDVADPDHEYNKMRRLRLALLIALHNQGNIANYESGRPLNNCPRGLEDILDEIKTLPREGTNSLSGWLHTAEDRISERQRQSLPVGARDAPDPVGQGGMTISSDDTEGGARIKLSGFDIAEFSPLSEREAFVPETPAIILDIGDSSSALFADGESLVGKIVVIDMHARSDQQGKWGLFPCEYAYAAQQAGACGVIFVYSSSHLRGTMRSLHGWKRSLDPTASHGTHERAIQNHSILCLAFVKR